MHKTHIHVYIIFMHVKLIYLKDHTDFRGNMSRDLVLESSEALLKHADCT